MSQTQSSRLGGVKRNLLSTALIVPNVYQSVAGSKLSVAGSTEAMEHELIQSLAVSLAHEPVTLSEPDENTLSKLSSKAGDMLSTGSGAIYNSATSVKSRLAKDYDTSKQLIGKMISKVRPGKSQSEKFDDAVNAAVNDISRKKDSFEDLVNRATSH